MLSRSAVPAAWRGWDDGEEKAESAAWREKSDESSVQPMTAAAPYFSKCW
jgi:hypothetical protein